DGEVNNGGFAQFFTNATGGLIGEAIAGAERTGLHTHSAILCEAANVFPGGKVPEDFDERNDVWDSFPERKLEDELNPLDDRWYAAEDEFLPRLERYVLRDHPEEFFRARHLFRQLARTGEHRPQSHSATFTAVGSQRLEELDSAVAVEPQQHGPALSNLHELLDPQARALRCGTTPRTPPPRPGAPIS